MDRLTYEPATEQFSYRSDKTDGPTAGTQTPDHSIPCTAASAMKDAPRRGGAKKAAAASQLAGHLAIRSLHDPITHHPAPIPHHARRRRAPGPVDTLGQAT